MAIPSQDLKMTHTCTKCDATKPEGDFYVRTTGWRGADGLMRAAACKECAKARTATWNAEYRTREVTQRWNANKRAALERVKDATFGAYGGYVCNCCGETERTFLTIDHVNNDGAEFRRREFGRRTSAGKTTYAWLAKRNFPVGYQVLCMNCQFGKRMNKGICPHQQVRRNDYPLVGVGLSGPKRIALFAVNGDEIVSPATKVAAAR
jgi:hypothetical protein